MESLYQVENNIVPLQQENSDENTEKKILLYSLEKCAFTMNGIFVQVVNDIYLIPKFLNFFFPIFNSALQCILCSIKIFFYIMEFLQSEAQNKS